MSIDVNNVLKECKNIVNSALEQSLHISNPAAPEIYDLPEKHNARIQQ